MQCNRPEHWEAALRCVRCLKEISDHGILLHFDSTLTLEGWYDSGWAACPFTQHSLTGWLVFLGNSPIFGRLRNNTLLPDFLLKLNIDPWLLSLVN